MPIQARAAAAAVRTARNAQDAPGTMTTQGALAAGMVVLCFTVMLLGLSLNDGAWRAGALAVLLPVAGMIWLAACTRFSQRAPTHRMLAGLVVIGLVARLALLASPPLYEDDYVRYLWDGGTTAHGINPYARSPLSVQLETHPLLPVLNARPHPLSAQAVLGEQSGGVLERVSYPSVTTIYPPIAQLGFAAAHLIGPWSLVAWKLVVFAAEAATLFALFKALGAAGLPRHWALGYWLCPLILKEFANGAHMDALLMPALAGLCWSVLAGRLRLAALLVGVAAGIKLWPVLLIAALAWRAPRLRERLMIAAIAGGTAALSLAPMMLSLDPANSGLVAYADGWVRNSLAFPAILAAAGLAFPDADAARFARLAVATVVGLMALRWGRAAAMQPAIATIAAWRDTALLLLLLSPTGYSWYGSWVVPFFVLAPSLPAGLLIGFIGAYYARFAQATVMEGVAARLIAPIAGFAPAWGALLFESIKRRIAGAR
ncbi:MAG: hypothetical protein ACKVOB_07460 [Sphingomonas sp.]